MNNHLTLLDYPIDLKQALIEAEQARNTSKPYVDPRWPGKPLPIWTITRIDHNQFAQQIIDDFGIGGKPRFYFLKPNSILPEHTDNGTTCSINFVLSNQLAPVTVEGTDYIYKQALLNTSLRHSVTNGPIERILLKISIFNEPYEKLIHHIKYKLKC